VIRGGALRLRMGPKPSNWARTERPPSYPPTTPYETGA